MLSQTVLYSFTLTVICFNQLKWINAKYTYVQLTVIHAKKASLNLELIDFDQYIVHATLWFFFMSSVYSK